MPTQQPNRNVNLIENFSITEKIIFRTGFCGVLIIALYGIYSESIAWGLIYMIFLFLGTFVILGCFCAYCPYPYIYSDCLLLPYVLIKKLFKVRSGPISTLEKSVLIVIMVGMIVIPQYWLFKNHTLLIMFWILFILISVPFPFYICRRCQNYNCPQNSARKGSSGNER